MALSLMEGNEAIGWGAVAAGCNFFAGYPITPATTIYNTMLKLLPPKGQGNCRRKNEGMENNLVKADFPIRKINQSWKSKTALSILTLSELTTKMTAKKSIPETQYRE